MPDSRNGHSRPLIDQYVDLLESEDIDFATSETGNALMIYGETEAGTCEGFIIVEELEAADINKEDEVINLDFCEIAYVLPVEEFPPEIRPGLLELIARLNESHRIGAYEYHIEEQELRFRIYLTLPAKQDLGREYLLMPLYEGVRTINTHWPAFSLVLSQGCDATHGVGEIFAKEALAEGFSEELLERANAMFELARQRYLASGADERLRALDTRLKQLAVEAGEAMARELINS